MAKNHIFLKCFIAFVLAQAYLISAFVVEVSPESLEVLPNTSPQNCNVNVCFAIDGSDTISPASFEDEKNLVLMIVRALSLDGTGIGYAAVQYGASNYPVSPFTRNESAFVDAVSASMQIRDEGTFVTAGLNYCFSELRDKPDGTKKIVLLGDGKNTIGREPAERTNLFQNSGGVVFAVGVGDDQNMASLIAIAGGDRSKVFQMTSDVSLMDITEGLVQAICDERIE